jgi:hypothetical protein
MHQACHLAVLLLGGVATQHEALLQNVTWVADQHCCSRISDLAVIFAGQLIADVK